MIRSGNKNLMNIHKHMKKEKAVKGKFEVSWLPGQYDGYRLTGPADAWNGHPIPLFELEEVWRIVSAIYDSCRPQIIETDDGEKMLYPLGKESWEWEEVKP